MLTVVAGLGWAAFRANDVLQEHPPNPAPVPAEPQRLINPPRVDDFLKLQELADVESRLTALSDQLQTGVTTMRSALEGYIQTRNRAEIGRYLDTEQGLQRWLARQHESLDRRRLQNLQVWLRSATESPVSAGPVGQVDLAASVQRAEAGVSNYVAAIRIVSGQSLMPEVVQKKLAGAQPAERELLNLAVESGRQAGTIAATFARWTSKWAETGRTAPPNPLQDRSRSPTLQAIFYGLVIALVLQCVLLGIAIHRRVVVTPLHQRLIESHTAAEQQRKLNHFARLATGLAHEIRNPLTAISIRLFTLQKSLLPGTSEHGDATLIRNEVDRLDQVLKNFLKLARPAESKPDVISPDVLLRDVCDLLTPQLKRQEITLKCESEAGAAFQGDPVQLKQVLINLVQNAADSIGRDGTVVLRSRAVNGRFRDQTVPAVILEVEDNGSGITPEVQDRLFDPFFSTKESGTGLGLPIAAKIIDQHHGRIDFETEPGRGTTFRVMLPAVPAFSSHG